MVEVSLGGGEITDNSIGFLKRLTRLEYLDISSVKVTDSGLNQLKGLTNLQSLWLEDCKVSGKGVKKLEQALPNCAIAGGPGEPLPEIDIPLPELDLPDPRR